MNNYNPKTYKSQKERKEQLNKKKTELNDLIEEITLLKNKDTSQSMDTLLKEIVVLKRKLGLLYKYEMTLNRMEKQYKPLSLAKLRFMANEINQENNINKNIIYNRETGEMFVLKSVNISNNTKEVISINGDVFKYEDSKFYQLDENIPDELFIKETRNHLSSYYVNNSKEVHYPIETGPSAKDLAYQKELQRKKQIERAEREFASEHAMMVRMCTPHCWDKD